MNHQISFRGKRGFARFAVPFGHLDHCPNCDAFLLDVIVSLQLVMVGEIFLATVTDEVSWHLSMVGLVSFILIIVS